MTSKADLSKENEKARECKEREEKVKDGVKDAVHDVKKGVKDLANKTEDMKIEDAPDRLLPSVERIDQKLADAEQSIADARTAHVGEKDLARYPKIQQVMKDAQQVLADNRALLKDKAQDGAIGDTIHHAADLAGLVRDQSLVTLDKLWTNWAAFLAVVAGTGAGSWKQILVESGHMLSELKNTQDFVTLLSDMYKTFSAFSTRIASKNVPVGEKLEEVNKEWEQQRDVLLEDWKRVWGTLNESPLWRQLVAKGKALKGPASEAADETKEKVEKAANKIGDSNEVKKLKQDFKNVFQLAVGKDGPDIQTLLDHCAAAYEDIVENEEFSRWAHDMSSLYESMNSGSTNAADYEKQMTEFYECTRDLLDHTVHNNNLRLAMRESKKVMKHLKKDPTTKKLLEDSGKLLAHLSDKKGVNLMDPQLLNEIRAVIVPILVDHFDNAPLPNYHGYDSNALGKFDYTLSGIRLGATGLVPSNVKVEFRYKAEANPAQLKMGRQQMLMYLEASDIQVAFKDVKWVYNRHTIPRMSDSGTLDLATAGKGITLKLKAELHDYEAPQHAHSLSELLTEPKDKKMFTVLRAECTIDDFHVRISDSGAANVFYEMLAGIWGTKVKHQIENVVEQKMNLLATKFNRELYDIVRRATQPSLAEETKDAILSAGQSAADALKEQAAEAKKSLQSM